MHLTQEDEELLVRYAGSLVTLWLNTGDDDYPLNAEEKYGWIGVLGLPKVSYQFTFRSRDEVWGRILSLAHLIGATELNGIGENQNIKVKL